MKFLNDYLFERDIAMTDKPLMKNVNMNRGTYIFCVFVNVCIIVGANELEQVERHHVLKNDFGPKFIRRNRTSGDGSILKHVTYGLLVCPCVLNVKDHREAWYTTNFFLYTSEL
jgi:hypothetical protein